MVEKYSEEKDESLGESVPTEVHDNELQSDNGSLDKTQEEELPDPLTECREEFAAEKDQRLRIAAEFANYRRRMENQRTEWSMRAKAGVIRTLLPILDDLERSITAAEETGSDDSAFVALHSGVSLVQNNFISELEKLGLKRIQTVGSLFDEDLHEAVGQTPAEEGAEDGHVLFESQAGYCLGDQVLRHAKVIVAIVPEPSTEVDVDSK